MCLGGLELKQKRRERRKTRRWFHTEAQQRSGCTYCSLTADPLKHFIPLDVQKQCDPLPQEQKP